MEKFTDIINSSTPVLIDFYADWCGPCKLMHPVIEEVAKTVGDTARVIKINIDNNRELSIKYNVRAVPTFMIFKNGELKWRSTGYQKADQLVEEIRKY